jgi:hypothetical protein
MVVSILTLKRRNAWFQRRPGWTRWRAILAPLLTFQLVTFTHVFFQAGDLHSAVLYVGEIFHLAPHAAVPIARLDWQALGLPGPHLLKVLAAILIMEAVQWGAERPAWAARFATAPRELRWAVYYAAAILIFVDLKAPTSFLYGKF